MLFQKDALGANRSQTRIESPDSRPTSPIKGVVAAVVLFSLLSSVPAHAFTQSTKNPKAGQFCATKEAGLKVMGLICKKSGTRYRWSH
jgi:hypothetical protein